MLSAHYRSPLNFSGDLMESAKTGLDRILTSVDNMKYLKKSAQNTIITEEEIKLLVESKLYVTKFEEAMDEDFNTADAISSIFELVKFINSTVTSQNTVEFLQELITTVVQLMNICGLVVKEEAILDSDIEALIQERKDARINKNFQRSDEIRDELLEKGIVLEDTREGVKWKRI